MRPHRLFTSCCSAALLGGLLLCAEGCTEPEAISFQSSSDSLLNLPVHQKYSYVTLLLSRKKKEDLTVRLHYLDSLKQIYKAQGTPDDLLLLEISSFSTGTCTPLDANSTLAWGAKLIREAEQLQDTFALATIHQRVSTYYYKYVHDYGKSFQHLLIVNKHVQHLGPERYPAYTYDTYYLAQSYFDFMDYQNAIHIGEALLQPVPAKVTNSHIFDACLVGMSYYHEKKYEQARHYFQWAIPHLPTIFQNPVNMKLLGWTGILQGNIGLTYYEQGDFEQAVPYLKNGLELTTAAKYFDNIPRFGCKLALICLRQNKLEEARRYATLSLEAAVKNDTTIYPVSRYASEPYQVLSDYYRRTNQPKRSMAYADSAQQAQAAWQNLLNSAFKQRIEIGMVREKLQEEERMIQIEKEREIRLRNILLGLCFLVVALTYGLYNRQQRRDRTVHARLRDEKQQAQQELFYASWQQEELRQRIVGQVTGRSYSGETFAPAPPSTAADYWLLQHLHQSVLLTDEDWTEFVGLFEKVHPGFLARLTVRVPDLTPAEVRYLVLFRLAYSSREMAAMLGVGLGAIRQYRLRVRRKLTFSPGIEIEEMVASI